MIQYQVGDFPRSLRIDLFFEPLSAPRRIVSRSLVVPDGSDNADLLR
jgi:hypothetical protein